MQNLLDWLSNYKKSYTASKIMDCVSLDLAYRQVGVVPHEIHLFANVHSMYLYYNSIECLPPEIGLMTNLKTVQLDNNKLRELPPEIGKLTRLQMLTLDNNLLSSLPSEVENLTNLTSLTIGGNKFTSIPLFIGKLILENKLSHAYFLGNDMELSTKISGINLALFVYKLHRHFIAKKYYYKWRAIIINNRGPKNNYEIYILQTYITSYGES